MTGLFFSRPCTSLTSAHPLRGFPRAGPFDAASELARVAEELKGVEGERKAVGASIADLSTRVKELGESRFPPGGEATSLQLSGEQLLELASLRDEKSQLLGIKNKLLDKEIKLLGIKNLLLGERLLLEKEDLLRGKALTAYDTATSSYVTLRTCYGYDWMGNRISETSPRANLSSCS